MWIKIFDYKYKLVDNFVIMFAVVLVIDHVVSESATRPKNNTSKTKKPRFNSSKYNLSLFDTSFEMSDHGSYIFIQTKSKPKNITQYKPKIRWKDRNVKVRNMTRKIPKNEDKDYEIEFVEYDDNELGEGAHELMVARSHDPFGTSMKKKDYELSKQHNEHGETRDKRGVVHLYNMITCATGCDPVSYKGYGCYCGFLGEGRSVDGIDRCCQIHDNCYTGVFCPLYSVYLQPYYWRCFNGEPHCAFENFWNGPSGINSCAGRLCECDRQLAMCLRRYSCVTRRALCRTSPLRLLQNLLMFK